MTGRSDPGSEAGVQLGARPGDVGKWGWVGLLPQFVALGRWQHHILPWFSLEPQPAVTGAIYSTCAAGVRFGPDITEAFLRDNGLRCILRGHEGVSAMLAWAELVVLLSWATTVMPRSLRGMQWPM